MQLRVAGKGLVLLDKLMKCLVVSEVRVSVLRVFAKLIDVLLLVGDLMNVRCTGLCDVQRMRLLSVCMCGQNGVHVAVVWRCAYDKGVA